MPKLKTKKGVAKRFRVTKKGLLKYHASGKSHLMSNKKTKRLRHLRKPKTIGDINSAKYLKRMLPYA